MSVTMEEIRARWPSPVCAGRYIRTDDDDRYCVGGAACRVAYNEVVYKFPKCSRLVAALCILNPELSTDEAIYGAETITEFNDSGNIDKAWAEVDRMLKLHR